MKAMNGTKTDRRAEASARSNEATHAAVMQAEDRGERVKARFHTSAVSAAACGQRTAIYALMEEQESDQQRQAQA